jgi:hypothetical protein
MYPTNHGAGTSMTLVFNPIRRCPIILAAAKHDDPHRSCAL